MPEIPYMVFSEVKDNCHSVSAGGFDHLAHVRQVPVAATWISEVAYNPNAPLEELFPGCTPICPSSWLLAWGFHPISQRLGISDI